MCNFVHKFIEGKPRDKLLRHQQREYIRVVVLFWYTRGDTGPSVLSFLAVFGSVMNDLKAFLLAWEELRGKKVREKLGSWLSNQINEVMNIHSQSYARIHSIDLNLLPLELLTSQTFIQWWGVWWVQLATCLTQGS